MPPSGFVAGMYARIDAPPRRLEGAGGHRGERRRRGRAGRAASRDAEQDTLNPIGVNVIRFFPASGIVIWGARTLATRSDPEYRYVPIRRLAIFLEQSIYNGIQWAVFEPNDEDLWASLRLNIGAFMMTQFRAGAFQGDTPAKAFFVKCDAQTNPQDQIDAGIVTILVGFAPLQARPSSWSSGSARRRPRRPRSRQEQATWRSSPSTPHRFDPYRNFKFRVKIDNQYVAGLSKCSALRADDRGHAVARGRRPQHQPPAAGQDQVRAGHARGRA